MDKIRPCRLALAGFVAGQAYLFLDALAGTAAAVFQETARSGLAGAAAGGHPSRLAFHLIHMALAFLMSFLVMGVYAAIRPAFKTGIIAAFACAGIFWVFAALRLGLFLQENLVTTKTFFTVLGFDLLGLPAAVLAGSFVFREKRIE